MRPGDEPAVEADPARVPPRHAEQRPGDDERGVLADGAGEDEVPAEEDAAERRDPGQQPDEQPDGRALLHVAAADELTLVVVGVSATVRSFELLPSSSLCLPCRRSYD